MANSIETSYEAADAVFAITELRENIFVRLDMKTLLLSQRVCKFWCDAITNSTLLQKKLFFVPATLDEAMKINTPPDQANAIIVPWDETKTYPWAVTRTLSNRQAQTSDIESAVSLVRVLNPLFSTDQFGRDGMNHYFNLPNLAARDLQNKASWRRMYLAHPSPPPINFFEDIRDRVASIRRTGRVEQKRQGRKIFYFNYPTASDGFVPALGDVAARVAEVLKGKEMWRLDLRRPAVTIKGDLVTWEQYAEAKLKIWKAISGREVRTPSLKNKYTGVSDDSTAFGVLQFLGSA